MKRDVLHTLVLTAALTLSGVSLAAAADAAKQPAAGDAVKSAQPNAPSELKEGAGAQIQPSTSAVKNPNDPDMKAGDDRAREKNKLSGEDVKHDLETGKTK